jgi:hypothetical protein
MAVVLLVLVFISAIPLRPTLQRERLELAAQGGRYRLTRDLRGLNGRVGNWIGETGG